jgi:uncharacterized protein (DUF58 family)
MAETWSRRVPVEFSSFALLFAFGVLLGNVILVILSMAPLLYLVVSNVYQGPRGISVERERASITAAVGQTVKINTRIKVENGVGLVICTDSLPSLFSLEQGSNLHVLFKGLKPLDQELSYEMRCTKRGAYRIGRAKTEAMHFSGLKQTEFQDTLAETQVLVKQRLVDVKKMRDPRLTSRLPMPESSLSLLGAETNDFREIRDYHSGDHFRSINWKVTARLSSLEKKGPLVNEYEHEGKKVVWVFLDSGRRMSLGTEVESAFEHATQAGWALSQYYLSRDCSVGACAYHNGKVVLPEMGRRQRTLLSRMFMEVQMADGREELRSIVSSFRGHLEGHNPLFIIITMIKEDNVDELVQGIKEMRAHSGRDTKVLVLHVNGYDIAASGRAERAASIILGFEDLPFLRKVKATGATIVAWNPREQSLQHLLLMGMGGRRAS